MVEKTTSSTGAGPSGAGIFRTRMAPWLLRLLLLVLSPLVVLGILEIGLRAAGTGHPDGATLQQGQPPHLVSNPYYTRKFFGARRARELTPFSLPVKKEDGVFRVVVLGGSAAQGDPDPSFGLPRVLELVLSNRLKETTVDVVSCAITASNSYVAYDVVRSSGAALDPDLYLVLMGNNEVIGPYGAAAGGGLLTSRMTPIRWRLAARRWRLVQMLEQVFAPAEKHATSWQGMEAFTEVRMSEADPRLERTYQHFRTNLNGIVDQAGDVPVLVATVPVNLADCGPFASARRLDLSADEEESWQLHFDRAVKLQADAHWAEAESQLLAAAALDDSHAELIYRLGESARQRGDKPSARRHFERARDLDLLRFRADSRINGIIREVAQEASIELVDLERIFADSTSGGFPGIDLFYEHVHFNFPGTFLAARHLAEAAATVAAEFHGFEKRTGPGLSESDCVERLAFTVWDRLRIAEELLDRLQRPPFTKQVAHGRDTTRLRRWAEGLKNALSQEVMAEAVGSYHAMLEHHPDDWVLHYNFGNLLLKAFNDASAAEHHYRRVVEMQPTFAYGHWHLAMSLIGRGQAEEALPHFETAVEIYPYSDRILTGLGRTSAQLERYPEAVAALERAVAVNPDNAPAHFLLGHSLLDGGDDAERTRARGHLERALELNPNNQRYRAAVENLQ